MKNTITTNSILAKACLLALLPAASQAQTQYDWTMKDDEASWGQYPNALTGGTYTRDHATWSGSYLGKSGFGDTGEGPYDGTSGLMMSIESSGIMTRTDPDAIFNLSAVGSSATIRTVYHYHADYPKTGGHGHLYQFGLTNNGGYFGKAGNESLIVAADFLDQNWTEGTVTFDIDLIDQTGLDTTGDGNWTPTPISEVASGLDLSAWNIPGDTWSSRPGKSQAIELVYTNIGNGKLRLDVGIMDLHISGRMASDTVTSTELVLQKSFTVNNNFSDLSALRPGFGLAFNDLENPCSGAAFDWEDAYPTGFSVPEPSSASLLGLGIAGFLLRRKRK